MRVSYLLPFIALWAATAVADEGSDVIDLDPANFKTVVDAQELMLVEFFAPWCGHCKALAPHYEKAATALKEKNIPLAKVDCVENADLCQENGVQGYPTLKVYRNGSPTDYTGPRQDEGIVSYMTKQSLPAVTTVTTENHDEFKGADKIVAIAYVSDNTDAPAVAFIATAEKHRDDYLFGVTTDADVIQAAGVKTPAIVLYRQFDEPRIDFNGHTPSVTVEEIETFIQKNSIPLVDEVNTDNYQKYAQSGLPLAYLFVDTADEKLPSYIEMLKPIAKANRGAINFVTIDATRFADHAKALNVLEAKWPAFVVQDLKQQLKYPLDQDLEVTSEAITSFIEEFTAGKIQPKLKSQPIPVQDEPVHIVVGEQFMELVMDDEMDVLIEFYAPWCGHCKRLKPTWDALGEKFADFKDRLMIAKMDATENDLPQSVPFRVSGFPTIKFKAAGSSEFVDYDGDRSLESLIEYVEKHAKNPLDLSKPFKGKKTAYASSTKVAATEAAEETQAEGEVEHEHDEL